MDSIKLEAKTVTIQIELLTSGDTVSFVSVVVDGVLLDQYRSHVVLVCLNFLQVLLGNWECYRYVRERRRDTVIVCQPSYHRHLTIRRMEGGGAVICWYGRDFVLTQDERNMWKVQLKSWLKELFSRFGETTLN